PRRDPVADGVLDERLERERRHRLLQRGLVDIPRYAETLAEAVRLELEVRLHELPLVPQRGPVDSIAMDADRVVEKVAELLDRGFRQGGIAAHQAEHGVERVEEEMRIELSPQGGQLRLRPQSFGPRGAGFLLAQPSRDHPGVSARGHGEVDETAREDLPGGDL